MFYKLVRSKRKSVLLQVKLEEGLVVRAPRFLSQGQIDRVVLEKMDWILEKQKELSGKKAALENLKRERGSAPPSLVKVVALKKIRERVKFYAEKYGFVVGEIRVTSAKTRWGSCSPNGNLNFSWRLYHAPTEVLDYVVVHELAHLRQRNHSRAFWAEVEKMMPDWKVQRRWLREQGYTLDL